MQRKLGVFLKAVEYMHWISWRIAYGSVDYSIFQVSPTAIVHPSKYPESTEAPSTKFNLKNNITIIL